MADNQGETVMKAYFFNCVAGTGHGVGAALNVHEGPQSVSARFGNMTGLVSGMIVSNEPGYYEDRAFGIRIEVCSSSACIFVSRCDSLAKTKHLISMNVGPQDLTSVCVNGL